MPDIFEQARSYYQSAASDPWRWAENGQVLVWADGSTVAFREEVAEIMDGLAGKGLPPFRLVVLILAACRGKLPPSSENGPVLHESTRPGQLEFPHPINEGSRTSATAWNDPSNQEFSELIARLRMLHQLPSEQRECPRVKTVLIDCILEGLSLDRVQPGKYIARALVVNPALRELNSPETRLVRESLHACQLLYLGLKNFSTVAFALRLRTGLDQLPAPAELDLRPSERARHFLATLRNDPEQQGLAKVARDIMAALYLPRSLSEPDELALGGFSDIANRGSLDRLLPSELANDDLTLATRIALNEALYIRREPPSSHPPSQLALLLDIGLRQWGLPRLFATAVALAFIARQEHCSRAEVWRARRTTFEKADLLSRHGLTDHLAALDTYAHPGLILKNFFTRFATEPETEVVLVTHRDCLADPDFQRRLAGIECKKFSIASVERDGAFELFNYSNLRKPLCQAQIDLDCLFPAPPERRPGPPAALREECHYPDLPLIFKVKPFPFLLPILGKIEHSCSLGDRGGLAVLKDRRLLRWDTHGKGAYTLCEKLPPGRTLWLGQTDRGRRIHVVKILPREGMGALTTWDSASQEVETTQFRFWKDLPEEAFERDGVLYLASKTEASAWQLENAQFLGKIDLPAEGSLLRRYFAHTDGRWSLLAFDGAGLRLSPLQLPGAWKDLGIVALFDRAGSETNPWALTSNADVVSSEGDVLFRTSVTPKLDSRNHFRLSQDGQRILVKSQEETHVHLIDLHRRSAGRVHVRNAEHLRELPARILDPVICPWAPAVRVKFAAISKAPGEPLLLRTPSGSWYKVVAESHELRLLRIPGGSPEPAVVIEFRTVRIPPEYSFRLKVATWPDGSRAWLDSRGLLHLKRGHSNNPEVSLVLAHGPLAAWSSDGLSRGPECFLHTPAYYPAEAFLARIELFTPIP